MTLEVSKIILVYARGRLRQAKVINCFGYGDARHPVALRPHRPVAQPSAHATRRLEHKCNHAEFL